MKQESLRFLLTCIIICFLGLSGSAIAADNSNNTNFNPQLNPNIVAADASTPVANPIKPPLVIPPPPDLNAKSYILMDYQTGEILAAKNMNDRLPPASLTKLMTLYIVFNAIDSGQIKITDAAMISNKAWKTGGSRMFLNPGAQVPVQDLIQGVIVDSGNDATVALAEYVAGSTHSFVPLMNQQAKSLGMVNSHFTNVDGLPKQNHYSSAFDLSLLARAIIHNFPDQYHWFGQKYYTWDNIKQTNRNWLLFRDNSVDGLKTGHTDAAGFCLVSSAIRNGQRLIAVVMGTPNEEARISESEQLLNYGFRFFKTYRIYTANTPITQARVRGGQNENIAVGLAKDLYLTIPNGQYDNLNIHVNLDQNIYAPVKQQQTLGALTITLNGKTLIEAPIIALENDSEGDLWTRISDSISMKLRQWFGEENTSNE